MSVELPPAPRRDHLRAPRRQVAAAAAAAGLMKVIIISRWRPLPGGRRDLPAHILPSIVEIVVEVFNLDQLGCCRYTGCPGSRFRRCRRRCCRWSRRQRNGCRRCCRWSRFRHRGILPRGRHLLHDIATLLRDVSLHVPQLTGLRAAATARRQVVLQYTFARDFGDPLDVRVRADDVDHMIAQYRRRGGRKVEERRPRRQFEIW